MLPIAFVHFATMWSEYYHTREAAKTSVYCEAALPVHLERLLDARLDLPPSTIGAMSELMWFEYHDHCLFYGGKAWLTPAECLDYADTMREELVRAVREFIDGKDGWWRTLHDVQMQQVLTHLRAHAEMHAPLAHGIGSTWKSFRPHPGRV